DAAANWVDRPQAERANIPLKIAYGMDQNLEKLAYAELVDIGKTKGEMLNVDILVSSDHVAYLVGRGCSQEGSVRSIEENTIAYSVAGVPWAWSHRSSRGTSG
ncbi:aldehyde dehydrogenase family protein, partial [Ideonella sp. B508-1]|uniref:aldehyde dehydrogenase family protein n=1 Tax=Ideonella sp. B508-1 TaxID=137716 RepID=UPI0011D26672